MIIEPIVEIVVVEVCSGEIRSICHPILSKIGSSGLGMNGSRIIRMTPSDDKRLVFFLIIIIIIIIIYIQYLSFISLFSL